VSIGIAAIIPVLSIVVLYFLKSDVLRLAMIGVFSACFAIVLKLVTNTGRTIEVFMATCA